ncbi:UDP-4-amino-4,6-dideoxy-N-acetyl-beta-L-altrosamine N-acetyltransferase [Pseudomonas sp. LP_7_YM]|uniref:UDP-4-amino-4, 6-dideoxy-N-acetyl-beta-L-altrosamine N-acetyltransferase n=1 Tax=Pseudomonas sp. LP_7_YM TaxID=2485137 RepID=UPI001062309D|nr:UDP-4-amino-4,6-dideoxy-N-acetyl-beta-L-altrosamine N-acetyltransferase [Pseudomonas sp. LP_7_YM]TDV71968.1 UDP-4-amino-4,6-dideoxy-N-acetyl-beta-L-altrosamine N-acetyltransferase [Pseudomonas sp. LP_7_YM]
MRFVPLTEASPAIQSAVRALRNQEDVRKFMYTSHEISPQEHEAWISSLAGNPRQSIFVAMFDSELAGVVSLSAINATQKTADWAFYLDARQQGKGLGGRVEFWLLDHAFNEAGLEKLNCEVLETNPAVVKMHQKFGFSIEGVRRKNVIKDGVRVDVVLLGITREEWLERRPLIEPAIIRASVLSSGMSRASNIRTGG